MTILQARKILGKKFGNLTNQEITDLLNQLYGLAEIVLDKTLENDSNKHPKVIDPLNKKEQNGIK